MEGKLRAKISCVKLNMESTLTNSAILHNSLHFNNAFQHFNWTSCLARGVMIKYVEMHIQISDIQLLPVDDDRVRGRLVTIATTFLVTAAAKRDGGREREEESS